MATRLGHASTYPNGLGRWPNGGASTNTMESREPEERMYTAGDTTKHFGGIDATVRPNNTSDEQAKSTGGYGRQYETSNGSRSNLAN